MQKKEENCDDFVKKDDMDFKIIEENLITSLWFYKEKRK